MPKLNVYIASKFHHAERWKKLTVSGWSQFHFTSRWFKQYAGYIPDEPEFCKMGWIHDIEDVKRADVVVVYGGDQANDRLRGALVEAGAALAFGRHVIVVGDNPDFGTWQYHPLVHKVGTLEAAYKLLVAMDWPPL